MNTIVRQHFKDLRSEFTLERNEAFQYLINRAKQPVDWVYEVWNELLDLTKTGDSHQRTLAVQLLAALAKSDVEIRLVNDLHDLIAVTYDDRFVTARQALKALWKVGVASVQLQEMIIKELSARFLNCNVEKNCKLIRCDIIEVLGKMYNTINNEHIKETVVLLIATEDEHKYQKKYNRLWNDIFKKKNKHSDYIIKML